MVQQSVEPIGEELIVCDMQDEVEGQHRLPAEGILRFRKIGIAQLDQIDQRCLTHYVQGRPLHIVPVPLLLKFDFLFARSELLLPPYVQHQVRKTTQQKVESQRKNKCDCTPRQIFVKHGPLGSHWLPVSDQKGRMAVVRPRLGHSLLHTHAIITYTIQIHIGPTIRSRPGAGPRA